MVSPAAEEDPLLGAKPPPAPTPAAPVGHAAHLKAMSLIMVTLQTTTMVILTRYTRVGGREPYSICSMVIMSELTKVLFSFGLLSIEIGSIPRSTGLVVREVSHHREECLKLIVPAGLYFFQNNVLIFAVTNLNTAQYQVCYQFKLVVTAILSVLMLKRRLQKAQWLSLVMLFLGIAWVNKSSAPERVQAAEQNAALGFSAVFAASFTSGLAGVYFEKLVKGGTQSVWMRNLFLAVFSLFFGGVNVVLREREFIQEKGFFGGFDYLVVLLFVVNAGGGMIVGMVMKYADNILKGFATGLCPTKLLLLLLLLLMLLMLLMLMLMLVHRRYISDGHCDS